MDNHLLRFTSNSQHQITKYDKVHLKGKQTYTFFISTTSQEMGTPSSVCALHPSNFHITHVEGYL